MGADISHAGLSYAGNVLAERVIHFIEPMDKPNGLSAVCCSASQVPDFVAGALPQQRLTKLSPSPADGNVLTLLFQESLKLWRRSMLGAWTLGCDVASEWPARNLLVPQPAKLRTIGAAHFASVQKETNVL